MICGVVVLSCTTLARAQGVPVCLEGLLTDVRDRASERERERKRERNPCSGAAWKLKILYSGAKRDFPRIHGIRDRTCVGLFLLLYFFYHMSSSTYHVRGTTRSARQLRRDNEWSNVTIDRERR